jgi:hypothetical protein
LSANAADGRPVAQPALLDAGGGKTAVAKLGGAIVRRQRVLFNAIYQEHKGLLFTGR